ncbi:MULTISPECIES: hypothetical protein [Aquimarina]|uniref:Uncharacterized protein n=2 Tax=Aquimarina algiphila TaxID=2047982 RepID=A0A554VNX7_9FLAO|nr:MULTISPECIES: hypothetical protein [Aquimarina]TSE10105.1 hypothetical protein FOF46_06145 [Aquimarina algiphila]
MLSQINKIVLTCLLIYNFTYGQKDSIHTTESLKLYNFTMIDGENYLTMRQNNENYLSGYRILSRFVNQKPSTAGKILQLGTSFLGLLITHEEGHRSVLTQLNIGAISQPFSIFEGAAYVKGVTDITLQNLRDTDLPNYIRLHTAGLESDFSIITKTESLIALEEDSFENLNIEYHTHKLALIGYYLTTLIPKLSPSIKEESNELDRDIVGHDLYGAVRHLHRPNSEFYRYTDHDDLTKEEKKFIKKVGFFSLLNLLNPILIGKNNFTLSKNSKFNLGLGYTMAPYGGFIDENFWLIVNNRLKIHSYLRQSHNKNSWFLAGGFKIMNYKFYDDKLWVSTGLHFWSQPTNLSFTTNKSDFGFATEFNTAYKIYSNSQRKINLMSNVGLTYKTFGFIPEYSTLEKKMQFNLGISILW